MAATLSAGTLTASCEMMWRDAFVEATKSTLLVATGEALTSLFESAAPALGVTMNAGT